MCLKNLANGDRFYCRHIIADRRLEKFHEKQELRNENRKSEKEYRDMVIGLGLNLVENSDDSSSDSAGSLDDLIEEPPEERRKQKEILESLMMNEDRKCSQYNPYP